MSIKFLANTLLILIIVGCQGHIKEVEQCMLRVLKPSTPQYLYLADLKMLATAALEYQLLPLEVQAALRQCYQSIEKGSCSEKFKTGNYEDCGIFLVPKCEAGYNRVDCSICAKECPEGTLKDAAGLLCQKPKLIGRKQFASMHDCVNQHEDCDNYGRLAISKCPNQFAPLGMFMCTLKCPDDFIDYGTYCEPPSTMNNDYCMNTFHEKVGTF